jgi:hypothetical protein
VSPSLARKLDRLLLAAGAAAAGVYIGLDLFAASLYPGYSIRDQAISELSAVGAPTAALWSSVTPLFGVLFVAFAAGLWRHGQGRALRLTAALIFALAALGPVWALAPMHQRGTVTSMQDAGHIALAAASVILITAFMISGAIAIGGWFGLFSIVLTGVVLATFLWTFRFMERLAAAAATPWLGAVERIAMYGYLLWIASLAVLLYRRPVTPPRAAV